ncbi:MAG: hypothetical protein ACREL3_12880 [Gemmatimonadales bacterium]
MLTTQSVAATAVALLFFGGCDNAFIVDSNGSIEVAISTRGPDPDPDGYSLTVDGNQAYILPAAGSLTLQLKEGNHRVQVGGLAENCAVDGPNPRTIVVGPGGVADVSFNVVCVRATTGGFIVVVRTSGTSPDPDGYLLSVAGVSARSIANDAAETFTGLVPGLHLITLKDLADGCTLVGGNPRPSTVVPGKNVTVRLEVSCGAPANPA